jgi:predicted nucleic acid-binding protein
MTSRMVVIDASIAIKAIFPNPLQGHCRALVQTFADAQPGAPTLWSYETTSAISKAVHFEQLTENEGRQALEQVDALGVHLFVPDLEQSRIAFGWTRRLRRASAYDSFYLALAGALECDFWTADKRLFNALTDAQLEWLHWIEELAPLHLK